MGKKILLADDSITIQKVIELTFSDEDFEVVTVGNGRLAVERVQEVRPDIVLCDIIMPEKDGYEVCDFIKRSPQLAHVPVLLLTGAFEPFDQERAGRVGCDGFLAKPFEPETLIAKVKDLLQKAAARGSSTGSRPAVQVPPPAPLSAPPAPVTPPPASVASFTPPPAPAPAAFAPAPPEPLPFVPRSTTTAPPDEVRFIPDEPFDDLDSAGFGGGTSKIDAAPAAPVAEPTLPPAAPEPEVYNVADELEAGPEDLLQMTPEESQSLHPPMAEEVPMPAEDSSSTVVFRPGAVSWSQPTIEVPLEARAQASVEAAQAAAARAESARVESAQSLDEAPVFEEVLEEDVENLVEVHPGEVEHDFGSPVVPPPPMAAPEPPAPLPPPIEAMAPEPRPTFASEPPVVAAPPAPVIPPVMVVAPAPPPLPEPEPEPEPEPVAAASPEPPPPPAPAPVPVPAPPVVSAPSAIESFVDVAAPAPFAAPAEEPAASLSAEVAVPNDMVAQIAQRVVAQISEKVVRQIAWEVIPDLAEGLIKKEIERLKAELQET